MKRAMQRGLGGSPHERYPKVYPLGLHQEAIALPKKTKKAIAFLQKRSAIAKL